MKALTWLLSLVAAVLLLILIALPAHAGSCAVVVRKPAVVVKDAVIVKEVVKVVDQIVTPFVAVPVAVPTFSTYYTPPVVAAPPAVAPVAPAGPDPGLVDALRRISERLDRLERTHGGTPPVQPPTQPMPPADPFNPGGQALRDTPFGQIAGQKCASCHDKSKPSGGFAMFDNGKLLQLTPEQVGDVIDSVTAGRMPRGSRMTPEERLQFVQAMIRK